MLERAPFPETIWDDEMDEAVVRMVRDGFTLSGIAEVFSRNGRPMSRSAVSGRVHRLRRAGRVVEPAPPAEPQPVAPAQKVRPERVRKAVLPRARPRPTPEPAPEPAQAVAEAAPASFVPREEPPADLASPVTGAVLRLDDPWPRSACRYPLFDRSLDRDEPLFCGARAERAPYCEAHRRLVYLPAPDRDRADRKDRGGNPSHRGTPRNVFAKHRPPSR